MSTKRSFIIHVDSLSVLKKLKDEQAGKLFKAIALFQEDGLLPEDDFISIVFEPFLNQFLRDSEKYQNIVERNKLNGSKGGRPKNPMGYLETQSNPKEPKKADSGIDNGNGIDSRSESKISNANVECKSEMINTSDLLNSLKENTPEIKKPKKEKKEIVIPDFVLKENWEAYLEMRKKKKASPTDFAIEQILKSLAEYEKRKSGAANESLKKSVINNWTDVYEPKEESKKSVQIHNNFQNQDYNAGTEGFIVG
jgi:hypothetical protein